MLNRIMMTALVVAGLVAFTSLATADDAKTTITGTAKSLNVDPENKNPSIAHATVTVTENGKQVVYYVHGWAGVICAKNDGKTVQVTGTVREYDGKKCITGKSVDVKVVVVE
ncbi:MAG: hypothetical protein HZA50_00945 [Planctomycetes bacterium]|nr:hypothetical protein [Planctomycetota bacterium]